MKKVLTEFPELIKEWHPTKNGDLSPNKFTHASHKKVWWLCQKGHEYVAIIKSRTMKKYPHGCPYCSGRRVGEDNNLKVLFPKVASEWHPTKNGDLSPNKFTHASHKKVWWLCQKGHEYFSSISMRTGKNSGCPSCSNQSSEPEIRIFTELKFLFQEVKNRQKIDGIEVDIFIPTKKLAIEYDGYYFHKDKEENDLKKNKFLESRKINFFRVRQKPLKKIRENDLIVVNKNISKLDLNRIVNRINSYKFHGIKEKIKKYLLSKDFINKKQFRDYLSNLPSPIPGNSLKTIFPNLVSEWDFEKNDPLTPENFTSGSRRNVWWICKNGHSYDAEIFRRTGKVPRGCPYCSGKRVSEENNLKVLFPKVASEWHPTKNGDLSPNKVTHASNKKVWWLCLKGHEYVATIKSRTRKKYPYDCRFCSGKKGIEKKL